MHSLAVAHPGCHVHPEVFDVMTHNDDDQVDHKYFDSKHDLPMQPAVPLRQASKRRNLARRHNCPEVITKSAANNCICADHCVTIAGRRKRKNQRRMKKCSSGHTKDLHQFNCARTQAVNEHSVVGHGRKSCKTEADEYVTEVAGFADVSNLSTHKAYPYLDHSYFSWRYGCMICDKKFMCMRKLRRHMLVHTSERCFVCEVCGKSFKSKGNMRQHLQTHNSKRSVFYCHICRKSLLSSSGFRNHAVVHTRKRSFSCNVCDKKFCHKGNLKTHMLTHTGERPFECELCSKAFTRLYCLQNHMRVHSGERLFCCKVCNKKFKNCSHLLDHMRSHTGERPFSCELCGKTFSRLSHVTTHMRLHTGEQPFECGDCKERFSHLARLKMHMRIHTGQ